MALAAGTTATAAHPDRLVVLLVAGALVVLSMPRFALVGERLWRLLAWSCAAVVAVWGIYHAGYLRVGGWWPLIAVAAVVFLALMFLLERERENRASSSPAGSNISPSPVPNPSVSTPAIVTLDGVRNSTFEGNVIVGDGPQLQVTDAENVDVKGNTHLPSSAIAGAEQANGSPISVNVDRDPEWRNFNHVAWIISLHVAITNQTNGRKEIKGYIWRDLMTRESHANIDVQREVARLQGDRSDLHRHAILEPGATEAGWVVHAADWTTDGKPPTGFRFLVEVDGVEYEAGR